MGCEIGMPRGNMQASDHHRNHPCCRYWKAAAVLCAAAFVMAGSIPELEAQLTGANAADSGPIQITADELVSRVEDNYAEFSGNVEAVQGDFVIRSERLQIHYRKAAGRLAPDPAGQDAIEKIIAIGGVHITAGTREARTDRAEYLVEEGLVVLEGENSTVTDGSNSITGSVIKLSRLDGKISVVGGPTGRVRAVFQSAGKSGGGEKKQPQ